VPFFIALGLALGLVRVEGPSTCPTAEQVSHALEGLPGASRVAYTATLTLDGDALRIELADAEGRALRTRPFPASGDCDELAAAAAVIIAAWIGELRPMPAERVALRPRPRPRAPSPLRWEIGVGFVAGLDAAFAPGGILDVQLAPRSSRFGGRLALLGAAPRTIALGTGEARYARPMVQLGPNLRFRPWRMLLDLHAEASLAVLIVEGRGFTTSQRDVDFDLGLGGGVRAAIRIGPVAPFIGASALGWTREQKLQVTGMAAVASLPRYEISIAIGATFGVFK
jgi:hypothetical protein